MRKSPLHSQPTREAIAQRAYEIYEREGRPAGRALEHWYRAEAELRPQTGPSPAPPAPVSRAVPSRQAGRAPALTQLHA